MKLATAIRLPEGIKSFSQGESTEMVSVPASFLNQILEEFQALRALREEFQALRSENRDLREEFQALKEEIARREATHKPENQPPDTNQGEEPLQKASVHEPKQGNNANIIFLDTKKREDPHEIKVLKDKIIRLETGLDKDMERISLDIALDRQRIAKLEQKEPQPLQKDRGEILIALIAASGGKVLAKYARLKMHLDKATFSRLLNTLSDKVTRKVHQPDHRKKLLVLDSS